MYDEGVKVRVSLYSTTVYNYVISLSVISLLPYLSIRPYTDDVWDASDDEQFDDRCFELISNIQAETTR